MECVKCHSPGSISLRTKNYYCESCFMSNVNHKFRACIGKNKILFVQEKVLICITDGPGSTVMLDLIYNGINMENQKKLRIIPHFLHISDEKNSHVDAQVLQKCNSYKFDVYMPSISEYMKSTSKLCGEKSITPEDKERITEYHLMMQNIPATARYDLLQKVKRNLFIRYAKLLDCKFIFTAETTTTLAKNLLSNLALGRGTQIENDIGFFDNRDEVKIIRPMKEISQEELLIYLKIKNLPFSCNNEVPINSLQSVIQSFVTDLQDSFQATISTICKTADKIGVHNDKASTIVCLICQSELKEKNSKLTALEAINFSRMVSDGNQDSRIIHLENTEHINADLFPSLNSHLCYSCSRNYSEINKNVVPDHLQQFLQ